MRPPGATGPGAPYVVRCWGIGALSPRCAPAWPSSLRSTPHVLPPRPQLLLKAADTAAPKVGDPARRPYLQKALQLLDAMPTLNGPEHFAKAQILDESGKRAEALKSYAAALDAEPLQTNWRMPYGRLLYEDDQLAEAQRQFQRVVQQQPNNKEAAMLLERVTYDLSQE